MISAEARMARIRGRLAQTRGRDGAERMMLVLAHETLRHQTAADRARRVTDAAVPAPALPCDYRTLIERVTQIVARTVPADARVLVISRGDDALTAVHGRRGAHFPQDPRGVYAGHHPADSDAAITHLEHCRQAGGQFLVLPATAYWWLQYYAGFALHVLTRHRLRHNDQHCLIFDLAEGASLL